MPQPRTEDLFLDLYAVEDNIRMDVASRSDYPAAAYDLSALAADLVTYDSDLGCYRRKVPYLALDDDNYTTFIGGLMEKHLITDYPLSRFVSHGTETTTVIASVIGHNGATVDKTTYTTADHLGRDRSALETALHGEGWVIVSQPNARDIIVSRA